MLSKNEIKSSTFRFNKYVKYKKTKKKKSLSDDDARQASARLTMLQTVSAEPPDFAYERSIGDNDSVYSNFIELMMLCKQKVGRIVLKESTKIKGYATGFLVSPNLLLTNWHVFKTKEMSIDSEVEFFYELDTQGRPETPITFKFKPNDFFFSYKAFDYCFIAVEPNDVTGKVSLKDLGYLYLDPSIGKIGQEEKEYLNVIHHPEGLCKQISIRENLFIKRLQHTLWYQSDTAEGSSGSPICNDQWQVVALHHCGVPDKTKDGKYYIDKKGNPIRLPDDQIDPSRIKWKANEGFRISVILEHFKSIHGNNPLVKQMGKPNPKDKIILRDSFTGRTIRPNEKEEIINSSIENNMENENNIQINIPTSLLEKNGRVNINVNTTSNQFTSESSSESLERFEEVRKVEVEDGKDYSDYEGYDEAFLGTKIALPTITKVKNQIAHYKDDPKKYLLLYQYYTTVHHASRKMPVYSAINVEGDLKARKDDAKRKDVWLRDNRIDYDVQLNDKFYSKSGFDKGHMSRREDADWGPNGKRAKEYADLTCMYTNACPQVAALNQSKKKGLWGKLEILILEKGASKEDKGDTTRISVFNGPVFSDDDRRFKDILIPMQFWKIVVWKNESKKLKATAFLLSQEDLVNKIKFDEELSFDELPEFSEHYISISALEKLTKLTFSVLKKYDTYKGSKKKVKSEKELESFILSHRRK